MLSAAIASTGAGEPVDIQLGAEVISADSSAAVITLENGQTFQGDVVIGADGFHVESPHTQYFLARYQLTLRIQSIIRQSIPTDITTLNAPPKAAVQFSVDVTKFGTNSVVQRFRNQPQRYEKWLATHLELNVYSIEPEKLLFDCNISLNKTEGRKKTHSFMFGVLFTWCSLMENRA